MGCRQRERGEANLRRYVIRRPVRGPLLEGGAKLDGLRDFILEATPHVEAAAVLAVRPKAWCRGGGHGHGCGTRVLGQGGAGGKLLPEFRARLGETLKADLRPLVRVWVRVRPEPKVHARGNEVCLG